MIYLDNSATTIPDPSVIESYQQVIKNIVGNPSSLHSLGGQAERLLETARKQVATQLGVNTEEIIFTSGGTEGNNMAIKGIALAHQNRGKHIITSTIEHPSVLEVCASLEKLGFGVTYVPVHKNGVVDLEVLEQSIREDTILISIMHVNNELGSIQPIREIGEIAKRYPKLYFHVDDVQGLGKVPLALHQQHVDMATFSGHKIHGLKGTGIFYIRQGTTLFPLLHGGDQEYGLRSGTEHVAGAVAIAKALRLIKESEQNKRAHLQHLNAYLCEGLKQTDSVVINSSQHSAPHIVNISIPNLKPETVIHALGEHDIYVSTTSACSSKSRDDSAVLTACGFSKTRSQTALRISLAYTNTEAELKEFLHVLNDVIEQLLN